MAVYDVNGNQLSLIYNLDGTQALHGYDLEGNDVYSETPIPVDYDDYTITNAWNYYRYAQGIDIHNGVVAIWDDHAYTITLKALSDGFPIATLYPDTTTHGNDISFTQEYYNPSDEFPLLCLDSNKFYRITRNSATLVRTFKNPVISTYNLNYGAGFDGNVMYVCGYKLDYAQQVNNDILILKLDLTDLTDNGDGTYTPAILNSVVRPWLPCIQGASFHDGLFWWACGMSGTTNLYGINPLTGEAVYDIELPNTGELEGLGWGYNSTDKWFAFIGAVDKGKYIKVTFGSNL